MNTLDLLNPDSHPTVGALGRGSFIVGADRKPYDIEILANEFETSLTAICMDEHKRLIQSEVTNFRIGEWADTIYRVTLKNGHQFCATGKQKMMLRSGEWVNVEELTFGTPLMSLQCGKDDSPEIINNSVEHIHTEKLEYKIPLYAFTVKNGGDNVLIANSINNKLSLVTAHVSLDRV